MTMNFRAVDNDKNVVLCRISQEALQDYFGDGEPKSIFDSNRSQIESRANVKHEMGQIESDGSILLTTRDF